MGSSTITSIYTTFVGNVATNLATNIPYILGIAAGLIGLGILIHYVRKWIGRK